MKTAIASVVIALIVAVPAVLFIASTLARVTSAFASLQV